MTENLTCENGGCKRPVAAGQEYCTVDCASDDAWRVACHRVIVVEAPPAQTVKSFSDGAVHSTDYTTGHTIHFAEWGTYGNAFGVAETAVALLQRSLSIDEMLRLTKEARTNLRSYLKSRGELAKGYRLKMLWQVDVSTDYAHPVLVFRAWEA